MKIGVVNGRKRSPLYFQRFVEHFSGTMRRSFNGRFYGVLFAVAAFLSQFTADAAVVKSSVLEKNVGYLRVTRVDKALPDEIGSALDTLEATDKLAGIVVDLRFASGGEFDGLKPTEDVLEQKRLPLAILVNAQTSGAAAGMAYDLREANAGLVFGSATTNLQPDVAVSVSATAEKDFLKNPYAVMPSGTNDNSATNILPFVDIDHTSEADLVREKIKDGEQDDSTDEEAPPAPQKPYIRDPVLAHGVDFIEGVAALHLNKG